MYRVDVQKLRGKMAERGYTVSSLAGAIGVNRNTLASYLSRPESIPYNKLSEMATLLCSSADECSNIFFAQ